MPSVILLNVVAPLHNIIHPQCLNLTSIEWYQSITLQFKSSSISFESPHENDK
jgi:hypothetical protein